MIEFTGTDAYQDLIKRMEDWNPMTLASELTPGTPSTPRQILAISTTRAGDVAMTFSAGGTVYLPFAAGLTLLPFSITKIELGGTTAVARYFNCQANILPFNIAQELVMGAAAIAARDAVLAAVRQPGTAGFALGAGGTLPATLFAGPAQMLPLAATQLVTNSTTAQLRAWNIGRS